MNKKLSLINIPDPKIHDDNFLFNYIEAAHFLKIGFSTIRKFVSSDKITYYKNPCTGCISFSMKQLKENYTLIHGLVEHKASKPIIEKKEKTVSNKLASSFRRYKQEIKRIESV